MPLLGIIIIHYFNITQPYPGATVTVGTESADIIKLSVCANNKHHSFKIDAAYKFRCTMIVLL